MISLAQDPKGFGEAIDTAQKNAFEDFKKNGGSYHAPPNGVRVNIPFDYNISKRGI